MLRHFTFAAMFLSRSEEDSIVYQYPLNKQSKISQVMTLFAVPLILNPNHKRFKRVRVIDISRGGGGDR